MCRSRCRLPISRSTIRTRNASSRSSRPWNSTRCIRRVADFSGADAAEIEADPQAPRRHRGTACRTGRGRAGARSRRPCRDGTAAGAAARTQRAMRPRPPRMAPRWDCRGAGSQAGWRRNAARIRRSRLPLRRSPRKPTQPGASTAATAAKIDRSRYETVLTIEQLNDYVGRAYEAGAVAIGIADTSSDPMQAELCGFSLAIAANEACYVPLSHRQGGDGTELFAGEAVPGPDQCRSALAAVKTLFEDPAVLKIGHNLKFAWQVLAHHGIDIAAQDDVMLMSYVLDAGRLAHGVDAMAEHWLAHHTINYGEVAGTGKAQLVLQPRHHRQGDRLRGRAGGHVAAAVAAAAAAARRRRHAHGLRNLGALAGAGARPHGAARHRHRPYGAVAPVGRLCATCRRARGRNQGARRRAAQSRLAEAVGRHPVRQNEFVGRPQDQDRGVVDVCLGAGGSGRGRPRAAAENPRMASSRRSSNRPTRTRCRASSIRGPGGSTPIMRWPPPPRGGCRRPIPICKTFRSAARKGEKSAAPSWPSPATS